MSNPEPRDISEDRPHHWVGLVVPALTFLVGLGLGGVLVYANSGGDAADIPAAEPSATTGSTEGTGDTVVTLPAACDEAAAKVNEAYRLLRQAVDQVRDFQANDLVDTLNQLQDVDDETRPLVDECSAVSVSTSASPSPSESASESESGSGSPEPSPSATVAPSPEPTDDTGTASP